MSVSGPTSGTTRFAAVRIGVIVGPRYGPAPIFVAPAPVLSVPALVYVAPPAIVAAPTSLQCHLLERCGVLLMGIVGSFVMKTLPLAGRHIKHNQRHSFDVLDLGKQAGPGHRVVQWNTSLHTARSDLQTKLRRHFNLC